MPETEDAEDIDELVELHISPKAKKTIIGIVVLLFVLVSAVIYLNEAFWHNESIPSWQQIYESAGLSESVDGSLPKGGGAGRLRAYYRWENLGAYRQRRIYRRKYGRFLSEQP